MDFLTTDKFRSIGNGIDLELKYFNHVSLMDYLTAFFKNKEYGASWKKRGGIGSFMMLARKWDRLEEIVKRKNYDIFESINDSTSTESIIDTIRDLRVYLTLVENEAMKMKIVPMPPKYFEICINDETGVHLVPMKD